MAMPLNSRQFGISDTKSKQENRYYAGLSLPSPQAAHPQKGIFRIEKFCYLLSFENLDLKAGLTDAGFDPRNPAYKF